jgi:hypothetical protein
MPSDEDHSTKGGAMQNVSSATEAKKITHKSKGCVQNELEQGNRLQPI